MTDPLSVAGSIAGLVSVGEVLFRKLYHYVKDVKNADKDIRDLKNEIALLNGVLHNLRLIAQDLEADSTQTYSVQLAHVKSCLATLHKLNDKLNNIGLSDTGKLQKTKHKLAWPFKSVNIREFVDLVRKHRDNLSFALAADSFTTLLKCLAAQEDVSKQIIEMDARLRNQEQIETRILMDNERHRVLDYFLFVDPQPSFRTSTKLRHPTTGFWLKENDAYSQWMTGAHPKIWMSGIPGAGKTVLSGLVIQECMVRTTSDNAVAFFYCDYKNSKSQSIVNILSTLASQIARQNELSFGLLKDYYDHLHPRNQLGNSPEKVELVDLLQQMSSTFENVWIVVDGLDECGENAREVGQALLSLFLEDSSLHLAVFSRDEVDIRETLGPPTCEHLEIAAQSKDLDHYVRSEIEHRVNEKRLRLKSVEVKEEIVTQLVARANGMKEVYHDMEKHTPIGRRLTHPHRFRWVSCQLDHLCELPTDAMRRKALRQLPETLYETYERLLLRIKEPVIPLVKTSLQWIAFAYPKLNIDELVDILALADDGTLDSEARPDPEEVFRSCSSLVRRGANDQNIPELAHFTVLEYLQAIKPDNEHLGKFKLDHDGNMTVLATSCIRYLCAPSFACVPPTTYDEFLEKRKQYPFHAYASRNHIYFVLSNESDEELFSNLERLFDPNKTFNLTYFLLQSLYYNSRTEIRFNELVRKVCSPSFGPLHAAAMLGLQKVCRRLLAQGCNVNQLSPAGSPLECALWAEDCIDHARLEHTSPGYYSSGPRGNTIAMLLDAGTNYEVEQIFGFLKAAKYNGIHALAQFLKHGMLLDVEMINFLKTAIFIPDDISRLLDMMKPPDDIAIEVNPQLKAQLLDLAMHCKVDAHQSGLSSDVIIKQSSLSDISDEAFPKAVLYSITVGHFDFFKNLTTDQRFTVDMSPQSHPERVETLLHVAMASNVSEITTLLLDLGADPTATDSNGQTALHAAIFHHVEDEKILRRLTHTKAHEIIDMDGKTVWHIAAREGMAGALKILLEELGAQSPGLRTTCNRGYSPILEAITGQHSDCAIMVSEALIGDQTVVEDWRVIHYAVAQGLSELLNQLIKSGVNPSVVSELNRTALFSVTSNTTIDIVDTLLDKGLDPFHRDTNGKAPLHAILSRDRRDVLSHAGVSIVAIDCLDAAIVQKLTTTTLISSKDHAQKTCWDYFCMDTVPYILTCTTVENRKQYLTSLMSNFNQHRANESQELQFTIHNIIELVRACLDSDESGLSLQPRRSMEDSDYPAYPAYDDPYYDDDYDYSTYNRRRERPLETQAAIIAAFLLESLSPLQDAVLPAKDEQLIRLLVWSCGLPGSELFDRLLDLGVDVHSPSQSYDNHSPIDYCCSTEVEIGKLLALLKRAEVDRVSKPGSDGLSPLHHLCSRLGTINVASAVIKLEALLKFGVDPNVISRDQAREAALHFAVDSGCLEAVQILERSGADFHLVTATGWGVIPTSVLNRCDPILEYLCSSISKKCDWESTVTVYSGPVGSLGECADAGCTPFHLAAMSGTLKSLQLLKDTGFFPDINHRTQNGLTALHLAATSEYPENIKWLINNGANVDATGGSRHETALHIAMAAGLKQNIYYLVEAGATFTAESLGYTPEMVADPSIRAGLIVTLPQCGVAIPPSVLENLKKNHRLHSTGELYEALRTSNIDACRTIIQDSHPLAVSLPQCNGCSPLIVALFMKNLAAVDLLLSDGAFTAGVPCATIEAQAPDLESALSIAIANPDMNSRLKRLLEVCLAHDDHWLRHPISPLHVAAALNATAIDIIIQHVRDHETLFRKHLSIESSANDAYPNIVTYFLQHQCSLETKITDSRFVNGGTPLHVAALNRRSDAVEKLIFYGADVNSQDWDGRTPLHLAAESGCVASGKLLLRNGAQLRPVDYDMRTPLMMACGKGSFDMISMLEDPHIDANMVDIDGRTALQMAVANNQLEVFIHLLNKGWDPYLKEESGMPAISYALQKQRFATWIHASGLDIECLVPEDGASWDSFEPKVLNDNMQRLFLRRLQKDSRARLAERPTKSRSLPLCDAAATGNIEDMRTLLDAGANIDSCSPRFGTALMTACLTDQLSSVKFLVRRGAKLESSHTDREINVVQAAKDLPHILKWLLVDRHTDQFKITWDSAARQPADTEIKPWSGVRQLEIPLIGLCQRPYGLSLFENAKYLRERRDDWGFMVPLDWDPVKHLTLTLEEIEATARLSKAEKASSSGGILRNENDGNKMSIRKRVKWADQGRSGLSRTVKSARFLG